MRAAEACGTPILNSNASSQAQSPLTQRWLINRNHQTKDFFESLPSDKQQLGVKHPQALSLNSFCVPARLALREWRLRCRPTRIVSDTKKPEGPNQFAQRPSR
jgi:hypothetical protein